MAALRPARPFEEHTASSAPISVKRLERRPPELAGDDTQHAIGEDTYDAFEDYWCAVLCVFGTALMRSMVCRRPMRWCRSKP